MSVREETVSRTDLLHTWEQIATSAGLELTERVRAVIADEVDEIATYFEKRGGGGYMTELPETGSWLWHQHRHSLVDRLTADGVEAAEELAPPSGFEGCTPGKWKVSKTDLVVSRTWSNQLGSGKVRATLVEVVTVDGEIVRRTPMIQVPRAGFKPQQLADLVADLEIAQRLGVAV